MTLWHNGNYDEQRAKLIKEFTANLEGEAFWRTTTKDYYFEWMSKMFQQYKAYVIQEHDRTGRAPITHLKNLKALMMEHGQISPAKAVQDDIDSFSEQ